ncbi:MAG: Ig-like domain-containing protein [Bacteroidales bacterium]|jgi:hypothetical protein|nr:Ig-like domain-containing protein [Bacteroidales bacterium]
MKRVDILILLLFLVSSCARIVAPVGGAKDVEPPKSLSQIPKNLSTNFDTKVIKIVFDEYFTLNNPNDNIIFSPPLNTPPTFTISGKSLMIKMSDTLLPNKTYNIVFSDAIRDFHEGNMLPLFHYTFATGSSFDSCSLSGKVINAKMLEPEVGIYAFLYEEDIDSLPTTTRPVYLTKTQKDGGFTFDHIACREYKIFALKDINNNLIFDLPSEGIAFADKMEMSHLMEPTDSVSHAEDSIRKENRLRHLVELSFFVQENTIQKLEKPKQTLKGQYTFIYKLPTTQFAADLLTEGKKQNYLEIINPTKDTINWYFLEDIKDTIQYRLTYDGLHYDTITVAPYSEPAQSSGRGRKTEKSTSLTVTHRNAGNIYAPFELKFSVPTRAIDSFPVRVVSNRRSGNDTLFYYFAATDTFSASFPLVFPIEEKISYHLMILDSVFYGFNKMYNDTINIHFVAKSEKDYGNLIINYELTENQSYVVSLLNAQNKEVQTDIINQSITITYLHLAPENYKIKVIEDKNSNGKWDTGNYTHKIQPERIFYVNKNIKIRGNWDLEETFKLD